MTDISRMPERDLRPPGGRMIDHYEILEPIGKGGFGEVWKARDTRLNRLVAIKRLPESFANDHERRERLRREALAASSLNHPNICTIHDFVDIGGEHLLVMEYVAGKTLHDVLATGPLPMHDALAVALQIAEALGEAHRHGIVHRDIKSTNIILTPRQQVKVLDFGLARPLASVADEEDDTEARLTRSGVTLGTLHYMSPEQLLGGDVDGRSDLFALGVVLYELLTGRLPFEGSSMIAVSDAILHRDPLPASAVANIPKEVDAILTRLLAKSRDERYADAETVVGDISAFVRPASRRRSNVVPWSVAAGILLLVAAMLFPLWQKSRREKWASQTLVPQIAQMIDSERYMDAVRLARTAQSIVPDDRRLKQLWPKMTMRVTLESDPPGANVYFAKYNAPDTEWELIGRTPLKDAPVPRGMFYRWKFEKKGYAPAYRIGSWFPIARWRMKAILAPGSSIPPRMIYIPGKQFELTIPGLDGTPPVQLGDFYIDEFEVTNEEYKKFVDAGGYHKREYWKQPFVRDGRPVPFEQAMKEFADTTGTPGPATWELGDYPKGQAQYPVGGVSWYEAAAYAAFAGKRLPTIFNWNGAAGNEVSPAIVPASNFGGHGAWPAGSRRDISLYGAYDMAGNVKEWCSNEAEPGKRYILGGGWNEPNYMFVDQDAQSVWRRAPTFGFRCMKPVKPDSVPADSERAIWIPLRDFSKEKPVSDELFAAYRSLYSYDHTPLSAVIDSTTVEESWTVQKISFDAAYGNERMLAYLYLPRNGRPPYQTVVFFPGSNAINNSSIGSTPSVYAEFVPRSGRALMFPIYKSTYERRDALKSDYGNETAFYRDHVLAWAKDLQRSIDYLYTRPDIAHDKLAYIGMSWGGQQGPIMAAIEPRLKACILVSGGLGFERTRPEADPFNFAPRVTQPVLMLNARYDHFFPVETSQLPLFRSLGTRETDKKYVLYESGHAPPRLETTKESLAWLDRYLGPVKR